MKLTKLIGFLIIMFAAKANMECYAQSDSIGDGLYRTQFTNIYGCVSEFQSFDPDFKFDDLQKTLSLLSKMGGKDRGLSVEFPSFTIYSNIKDKKQLIAFGKKQIASFQSSLTKLKAYKASEKSIFLKDSIVNYYRKRLEFEKIAFNWLKTGDDATFRKSVLKLYKDNYMEATLDKVLAIKDWEERFKYTYAEVNSILSSKIYVFDEIVKLQVVLFSNNKLKIVSIDRCKI